jgi:hypothetical protein
MRSIRLSVIKRQPLVAGSQQLTASSFPKIEISPSKNFAYTFADSFLTKT